MGGHNSKFTPEAEAVPPRIRPILQRKFEEIRNRTRARKLKPDATLSKKELLKNEDQEEGDTNSVPQSQHSSPDHSLASPKVPSTPEKKSSKVAPVLEQKGEEVEKNKDQKRETIKEEHKEEQEGKVAKVVPVFIGGVFALEQAAEAKEEDEISKKKEEDEDHEEGTRSNTYEMLMCPSSPSFRVYCQEALEIEKEFDEEIEMESDKEIEKEFDKNAPSDMDDCKQDYTYSTDDEINHKKSPSRDSSVESIPDNSGPDNEGQDTKTKKKVRRRRRIKNPFNSMGGANCSVKHLLNVGGCYNVSRASANDRTTLLEEKSPGT